MDYRVSYEHSLASHPDAFIVQVPGQVIADVPASVPRALVPEFIADLIRQRLPRIGRIRSLRTLSASQQGDLTDDRDQRCNRCRICGWPP